MHETAVAWAADALGRPVQDVQVLPGGLTSTILRLTTSDGERHALRLMTNEPWRTHGAELTRREREAQEALVATDVPAPRSLALDADGEAAGVAAHLMTLLPGSPRSTVGANHLAEMARMLAAIHAVRPGRPFRSFQSWAWEAKWVVPAWSGHPSSWERAFDVLAQPAPDYEPTFLHRDFSHRNLLWDADRITGVVDWVETSTGPAGLDAAHAATNLAVMVSARAADAFLRAYTTETGLDVERHWLVMDAVGFLPPPGRAPMFGAPGQLKRLDAWLHGLLEGRAISA